MLWTPDDCDLSRRWMVPRLVAFLLLLSDDSSGELSDGPEHAQCRASSLGSALCSFTTCSSVNAMTVFISRHLGPHARPCTRHFTRSISFNPITTSEAYYAPLQTGMRKSRRFDQRTQATQLVSGTPRLSSGSLTPEPPMYHFLSPNPPTPTRS